MGKGAVSDRSDPYACGTFQGAARPSEENFCETPAGSSTGPAEDGDKEARLPAALKGADLDAPVMMYCTGGIRCDVYSAYLRQQVSAIALGDACPPHRPFPIPGRSTLTGPSAHQSCAAFPQCSSR